jgi:agmatinase
MTVLDPHIFRPTQGFMRVPSGVGLEAARAAILGMPFDCGADPYRVGARQGPGAIRDQAIRLDGPYPSFSMRDPLAELAVMDCGNANVISGRIEEAYEVMESAVNQIADAGAIPVTMGGDGAVTLPQLRAMGPRHRGMVVVHFDSHTDAYPIEGQRRHTNATTFNCAAEEGLLDTAESWHIGIRGTCRHPDILNFTRDFGYRVVTADTLFERGISTVIDEMKAAVGARPVYLCWDMDVFDPSCAPGVCDPTWGGLTAREGIAILRSLTGLNIVACDVNTVSPPHDVAGMTALLAANVMLLCLHLINLNQDTKS